MEFIFSRQMPRNTLAQKETVNASEPVEWANIRIVFAAKAYYCDIPSDMHAGSRFPFRIQYKWYCQQQPYLLFLCLYIFLFLFSVLTKHSSIWEKRMWQKQTCVYLCVLRALKHIVSYTLQYWKNLLWQRCSRRRLSWMESALTISCVVCISSKELNDITSFSHFYRRKRVRFYILWCVVCTYGLDERQHGWHTHA